MQKSRTRVNQHVKVEVTLLHKCKQMHHYNESWGGKKEKQHKGGKKSKDRDVEVCK